MLFKLVRSGDWFSTVAFVKVIYEFVLERLRNTRFGNEAIDLPDLHPVGPTGTPNRFEIGAFENLIRRFSATSAVSFNIG